jgi:hypothetical protein
MRINFGMVGKGYFMAAAMESIAQALADLKRRL